jgi:hypothetical protein
VLVTPQCDQLFQKCTRCGARREWNPNEVGGRDSWPLGAWAIVSVGGFDQRGNDDGKPAIHVLCGECLKPIRKALLAPEVDDDASDG